MKRDMDLVRSLLLDVEGRELVSQLDHQISIPGYSYDQVVYHIQLLDDAGLLIAEDWSTSDGHDSRVLRLTWSGHEFLDNAKEESRWQEAKRIVKDKAGDAGFEVLRSVLVGLAMRAVGLSA